VEFLELLKKAWETDWRIVVIAVLAGVLMVSVLWDRGPRHTKLNWGSLAIFLRNDSQVERTELPDAQGAWGIGVAVQLQDALGSAVYKRVIGANDHIEMLDVLRLGEPEFFVTFSNGKPVRFSRATGRATQNPMFNAQQSMILIELLRRARKLATKT
jgi:hypothetical protein